MKEKKWTKAKFMKNYGMIIGRGANQIQTGRASILPKHPATTKLLTNLFSSEEAKHTDYLF